MIAIIDYGMGNIHSVKKALELFGARTLVTNKKDEILKSAKIVLPGVGAFADAMQELEKQNLVGPIQGAIKTGLPFLGICLGMQLLFEISEEAKGTSGLGVLKGAVKKFNPGPKLKVPHMGWNQLKIAPGKCPLLKNIPDGSCVYFCHSYYPAPEDKKIIAATCDYGRKFSAIVWQDNVYGVQFHPEKSQAVGLGMIKNFVKL